MGGLIASYAALKAQQEAKKNNKKRFIYDGGVVLSSPFFGVAPEADIGSQWAIVDKSLRFLSRKLPKLQCIALNNKGMTSNKIWEIQIVYT